MLLITELSFAESSLFQSLYDDGTETTRRQLLSACVPLQTASEECVESLLSVWRGLVLRVYRHYQLSAKAYFTYLKLNGQVDCILQVKMTSSTVRLIWHRGKTFKTIDLFIQIFLIFICFDMIVL